MYYITIVKMIDWGSSDYYHNDNLIYSPDQEGGIYIDPGDKLRGYMDLNDQKCYLCKGEVLQEHTIEDSNAEITSGPLEAFRTQKEFNSILSPIKPEINKAVNQLADARKKLTDIKYGVDPVPDIGHNTNSNIQPDHFRGSKEIDTIMSPIKKQIDTAVGQLDTMRKQMDSFSNSESKANTIESFRSENSCYYFYSLSYS